MPHHKPKMQLTRIHGQRHGKTVDGLAYASEISLDLRTLQGITTLGRVQLLDAFAVYIGMQRSAILV